MRPHVNRFAGLAVGLAVLYVVAALAVSVWVYTSSKSFVVDNLGWEERTGSFLGWGATLLFTGGGLVAIARILFFGSKNPVHFFFALLPAVVPWGLDVMFGKPVSSDGTNRLCCNKRPDRELFCHMIEKGRECGFDPITQDRLRPASPKERLAYMRHQEKVPLPERKPNPCVETAFFDEDGAIVWYYEQGGRIDLFDDSGKHPTYGEELLPITKPVVMRLRSACATSTSPPAPSSKPQTASPVPAATPSSVEPRAPAYARYLNQAAIDGLDRVDPVVIKGNSDAAREVIGVMGARLQQGIFSSAFVAEGVFDRAIQGDADAITRLQLPKQIRKIVLVQVSEIHRSTIADAQSATRISETVHVAILDARSGAVIDSTRFVAEGAGFAEQYVKQALKEDMATKLAELKRSL